MKNKINNMKFKSFAFRYLALILVLLNLLKENNLVIKVSLIFLTLGIGLLDYISTIPQNTKKQLFFKSLVAIGLFLLIYNNYIFAIIYLYIFTFSILSIYTNNFKYFIFVLLLLGYTLTIYLKFIRYESFYSTLETLYTYILPYLISVMLSFISYNRKATRIAISKLNKELTIQNKKLQEYSSQIEELTISAERTRVAQELHDSLGHYLMAISMHLDILEKVKSSPEKSEEILTKTKGIVKNSIQELRNTVFQLKEMKNSTILSASINELIQTSTPSSEVTFNVDIDNQIEIFPPFIKSIIYKTIQESITNGIKHGNATCFDIKLTISSENIDFFIRNFGIPPRDIIKSNGLKGITERIELTRGSVSFITLENGFLVKANIPVRKEDKVD